MHRVAVAVVLCFLISGAFVYYLTGKAAAGQGSGSVPEAVRLQISLDVVKEVWVMTHWSEPPQIAVWLENYDGTKVRTLFVTHRTGAGDWEGKAGCSVALPYWVGRYNIESGTSGPPTHQEPVADGISGATPEASLLVSAHVPIGSDWYYYIEVNASGDYNEAFSELLKNGRPDEAGNAQPSLVYRGSIKAVPGQQSSPELIGRTDQIRPVTRLNEDLSGITTAKNLLSRIEAFCLESGASSEKALLW